jgi:hypothetical protein
MLLYTYHEIWPIAHIGAACTVRAMLLPVEHAMQKLQKPTSILHNQCMRSENVDSE